MGYGINTVYARSPAEFCEPPRFGVWLDGNQFTVHKDMSQIKAAITRSVWRGDLLKNDARVYEWIGDDWVEKHVVPAGTHPKDHTLWKSASKKPVRPVPQKALDAAMASILQSSERVEDV